MATLTVNEILDDFVPDILRNDFQRLRGVNIERTNDGTTIRLGYENDQIALEVERYVGGDDVENDHKQCRVIVAATDRVSDWLFPGLVAHLPWIFHTLAVWNCPSMPRIVHATQHRYHNVHVLRATEAAEAEMPAGHPILAHA